MLDLLSICLRRPRFETKSASRLQNVPGVGESIHGCIHPSKKETLLGNAYMFDCGVWLSSLYLMSLACVTDLASKERLVFACCNEKQASVDVFGLSDDMY